MTGNASALFGATGVPFLTAVADLYRMSAVANQAAATAAQLGVGNITAAAFTYYSSSCVVLTVNAASNQAAGVLSNATQARRPFCNAFSCGLS